MLRLIDGVFASFDFLPESDAFNDMLGVFTGGEAVLYREPVQEWSNNGLHPIRIQTGWTDSERIDIP